MVLTKFSPCSSTVQGGFARGETGWNEEASKFVFTGSVTWESRDSLINKMW